MKRSIFFISVGTLFLSGLIFAQNNIVVPYCLKAHEPITVDGELDEWNFCFPIDFNHSSISADARCRAWISENDDDLSGTIKMMYDEDYLYVAARVKDYYPGAPTAGWASDGIEVYLGNWDIGDSMKTEITGFPDDAAGHYAVQLGIYLNGTDPDSLIIVEYYQADGASVKTANNMGTFKIWPDEDGYDLEAKISWVEIDAYSMYGNTLAPEPGTRVPCTWSLFSVDESGAASFAGYQYTVNPYAPWQGASAWEAMEFLETSRDWEFENDANFTFVQPYCKRAKAPIDVDGDLSEWNFCFPIDFNRSSVPANSRCWGWIPENDDDLSGTIKMMYDDDYLYMAAHVKDYYPGAPEAGWAADGIEVYLGNWDIGDSMKTEITGFPDDTADHYAVQIGIYLNGTDPNSLIIIEYYQAYGASIKSANTTGTFEIWPDEDGYDLEAKISWAELDGYSLNGNSLKPDAGTRVPCTWSLFSINEDGAGSFEGYQYTTNPDATWQGALTWQYVEFCGMFMLEEAGDDGNDNEATQLIVNGDAVNGSISTIGEEDWYCFTTNQNGTHIIETHGSMDTYMTLYQSNWTTIIEEDDDDGAEYCSKIVINLSSSTTYYVKVKGYSNSTGAYSIDVKGPASDFNPPRNLVATGGNQQVSLSWTAPFSNSTLFIGDEPLEKQVEIERLGLRKNSNHKLLTYELDGASEVQGLNSYKVYRSTSDNGSYSFVSTTSNTYYTDTGRTNGITYWYYVTAVYSNPSGESDPSNKAGATPLGSLSSTTLLVPNGGDTLQSGNIIDIQWQSTDVINVNLFISYNNGASWDKITTNISSTGIYSWTVPYIATKQGLIKIEDASSPPIYDISDAVFTIKTAFISGIDASSVPTEFTLRQNYPNPFNAGTWITYGLPLQADVTLTIYNVQGQRLCIIQEKQDAGYHSFYWDGRDRNGNSVVSGIYIYRIEAKAKGEGKVYSAGRKMFLLK